MCPKRREFTAIVQIHNEGFSETTDNVCVHELRNADRKDNPSGS